MSQEPEDSELHDDEPGSGRGFPAPVVESLVRPPLNMAESKKVLLKKLQQQTDHSKAEALQDELQAEKIRCRHLSMARKPRPRASSPARQCGRPTKTSST